METSDWIAAAAVVVSVAAVVVSVATLIYNRNALAREQRDRGEQIKLLRQHVAHSSTDG